MGILDKLLNKGENVPDKNSGDTQDSKEVKRLIAALSDNDAYKDAQKALVKIGEPSVEPLIEALQSGNEDVLWWAARSLGSIGDSRAAEPLIRLYENPPSERIRTAAGLSLGKLGDLHAIPTLVYQLQISNFISEVKSMLLAFGPAAVEHIIAFIKEKEDNGSLSGVSNAIEVLGMIGDPRAEETLRAHVSLDHYPDNIKNLAAEALSKLGLKIEISQDEIEKLKRMLLSNDYDVRKTALEKARSVATSIDDAQFQRALQASESVKLAYDNQNQASVSEKPIQSCLDAIELEPQFAAAYVCLSYLYRTYTAEKHNAVEWAEKAIELNPKNMNAWIEMGMVHAVLGDVPKAVHAFHHVVSMEPSQKNLEPHCRLVAVYRKLNMQDYLSSVLSYIASQGVGLDPSLEREWEQMVMATDNDLLQKAIEGNI
ncbi:MAG: hypothetical protein E4G99_05860 [Anaerolineales bacterium]|nr:MAG: hypothetical protein E4G99_05860 [Anaerolineales bacterium]